MLSARSRHSRRRSPLSVNIRRGAHRHAIRWEAVPTLIRLTRPVAFSVTIGGRERILERLSPESAGATDCRQREASVDSGIVA